jgi:hypothetical protein
VIGILDSGAYSDAPADRLTSDGALVRQLKWESEAERFWKYPWRAEAFVSYDLLIDEKWTGRQRKKQRWSVADADLAVRTTVDAAAYLSSQRERLSPRRLILACQGVDGIQYAEAASGVLAHAQPGDWFGLGGWCILGWWRSWIPVFWDAMRRTLPQVLAAGVMHCHIFGVMYPPVLAGLLWLCDACGLTLSTDSSGPVLQVLWKDKVRAGAYKDTWEANVEHWLGILTVLRESEHYREPPLRDLRRQLTFC